MNTPLSRKSTVEDIWTRFDAPTATAFRKLFDRDKHSFDGRLGFLRQPNCHVDSLGCWPVMYSFEKPVFESVR